MDLENYREQSYINRLGAKSQESQDELESLTRMHLSTIAEFANARDEFVETQRQKFLEQVQLNHQIELLRAELDVVRHGLHKIHISKSWRMTRPFRGGRKALFHGYWKLRSILKTPRIILRPIYQKLPFLIGIRMRLGRFVSVTRYKTMRLINSKNNLKALQDLVNRRFRYRPSAPTSNVQSMLDVSVVTYNSSRWVDGFFASLKDQDYPLDKLNLCVVDNGSTDRTIEDLQLWKTRLGADLAGFEIIRGENVGFGLGHDSAIKTGCSEFVLISNVDIFFKRDSITSVLEAAYSDKSGTIASWELRQLPYEHPKYYDPVTQETTWSSHACILIRRSAYIKVGGYEHEIFMYGEDVELSYRFRSFGYQLKYCPSAVVNHYTYEHENHLKPIQFAGSTLANSYLRLRYGSIGDRIGAVILQAILLFRPEVYAGSRLDLITNIGKIVRKAPHFLSGKGPSKDASYPFRGFDYEMVRDGAFWPVGKPLVESPLVTIVIRTYRNRDELLRQAIISVLNQTYPNLELVVVEDGGHTMQGLVSEFQRLKKGLQIHFFGMDKVGRSVTGNFGLEMAKGKYCLFLDDDDLLFADHIEVLVAALAENPESVAAYSLAMEVKTNREPDGRYTEFSHATQWQFRQAYDYDTLLDHNFIPIQSLLFQRLLYLQRGGFETDMSNLEDWNLWLRYGYGNTFTYVPKTTSLFRTPADLSVRQKRHELLHEAYFLAKSRAVKSCEGYTVNSRPAPPCIVSASRM